MFNTTDPRGYNINCSTETWNNHIVDGHEVMEGKVSAVKSTIENPEVIYLSSQSPVRNVYFAQASTIPNLYTKVIVEMNETSKSGEIVSAWPQKTISGGIDPGGVLYVKNKL